MKKLLTRFLLVFSFLPGINFLYGQQTAEQGFFESPLNPEFVKYMQNSQEKTTNINLGEIPSPDVLDFTNTQPYITPKSLPSFYDLRTEGDVTPVKDQVISGPCWAFGTLGAVESSWKKSGYGEFDFSEKNLAGCHGFVNTVCNGGNMKMATAYLTRIDGPVLESADPYPVSPVCPAGWSCGGSFTSQGLVTRATYLPGKGIASFSIDLVKTAIYDHGGVYANMYYNAANYNSGDFTYYYSGTGTPNQGVLLVGWDDSKVTASTNPGAWIVKNSLGTSWGESGYFYISYDDTKALTDIAYYPTRATLESNAIYCGYDKLGPTGAFGWNDGTDWNDYALIKFIATNNQKLKRVGTAVVGAGTTLSFDFYSDFDGTTLSGLLGSMPGIYCEYPGTYYFDVTDDINVSRNDSIFIQVTYNTPNLFSKIPVEMSVSGYASPQVLTKVCWARRNDLNLWRMLGTTQTTGSLKSDLCIKATYTPTNEITFNVTDGLNPITNVTIDFNGNQYLTNVSGQAIAFCQTPGDYDYVASVTCYNEYSGNFTIDGDEIVDIVMTNNPVIASISDHTNVTCNGLCNGFATTSPSGGTSPYTYTWSGGSTPNAATTGGLCAGTYTVTVKDATLCPATASVTITQPAALLANISGTTPITCVDDFGMPMYDDATATVAPVGGTPPYTYNWTGGQTTQTAVGLGLGTYFVTVTDNNFCTAVTSATTTAVPKVTVSIQSYSDASCLGNDGTITSIAINGKLPYSYRWNTVPIQTTATAINLTPGTYRVTVTDGCMNMATATQAIVQAFIFSATMSKTNVTCSGANNGTATITPVGGTSPYSYIWSNGQTTQTSINLAPGMYSATVTNTPGCTATGSVTIATTPAVSATISGTTPVTCRGGNNGTATAQPVNGSSPYTYRWSTVPVQTTQTAINLSAAMYTVTITDACPNTATANATITQPAALAVTITVQAPACAGSPTGSATANPTGGTLPYTDLWGTVPVQTTQTAINLTPGSRYWVTVTDACGATKTLRSAAIPNPIPVSVTISGTTPVTCRGGSDGTATAQPADGLVPYTYRWNTVPVQTTQTAINLSSGITYRVTVTDGCASTAMTTTTISQPAALAVTITVYGPVCGGTPTGSATANPTGGTSPYTYRWSTVPVQTTQTAVNLTQGSRYWVTVTDACGATTTLQSAAIPFPIPVNVTIPTFQNPSCAGVSNGSETATPANGSPPYTYLWSTVPAQTTQTAVNLAAGIAYWVTVTDGCGNTATASRTLTNSYTLATTLTYTCSPSGQCIGTATSTPTNGVSPYSYYWNNGQTTQTAVTLCVVRYYVTTTDANGCTSAGNIAIKRCAKSAASEPGDVIISQDKPDLAISPNPATTSVLLSGNEFLSIGDVRIYNSTGQIMYIFNNIDFSSSDISIDISQLKKGLYMMVVYTGAELISKRLVVE